MSSCRCYPDDDRPWGGHATFCPAGKDWRIAQLEGELIKRSTWELAHIKDLRDLADIAADRFGIEEGGR